MNRIFLALSLAFVLLLSGCAGISDYSFDRSSPSGGIYHAVKRGETLWAISKVYGIELEKLIKANRMPDASKIEIGQLIFVPGATAAKSIQDNGKVEGFIWPIKGSVISYFGSVRNMTKNKGIDVRGSQGAGIRTSRSGNVTFVSENMKGYGKTIIIDHLDGFQTVYAYNAENLVIIDQHVTQGDVIARVGKTGRADTPTLHFEVRKKSKPQNPFYYLP